MASEPTLTGHAQLLSRLSAALEGPSYPNNYRWVEERQRLLSDCYEVIVQGMKDTERLDWLERHLNDAEKMPDKVILLWDRPAPDGSLDVCASEEPTLRAAIDAACSPTKEEG